jgi:hypothetical protein
VETKNGGSARNVVDLVAYRLTRKRCQPKQDDSERLDDGATHVYIDLDRHGRLDYGLAKVTEENALTLLVPWFFLGSELIKFYAEWS